MKRIVPLTSVLFALAFPIGAAETGGADDNRTLEVRQIVHTGEHGPSGKKAPGPSDRPKVPRTKDAGTAEADPDILYLHWEGGAHETE
jgi:hypothetical protein